MANKSQKARDKAREYFGLGVGDDDFVLHHVDITLKTRDPKRYDEWRPEDLCIMSRSEHARLHHIGNKNWEGKKHSEESRKKMSEAHKGQIPWTKGKKLSEVHKNKISSAAHKLPVEQCTLDGELVRVWESAIKAEKESGFNNGNIGAVCRGKRPHHKGYVWRYA